MTSGAGPVFLTGSRSEPRGRLPLGCADPTEEAVIDSRSTPPEPPPLPTASSRSDRQLHAWVDSWQAEPPPAAAARQRAAEVGVGAVDPATGALLRLLAAATGAKAVVELGTGAGVSSLWLLGGLGPGGVLTSVDSESEHQRLAKASLSEAGVPSGRARLITGRALEVLPRLSDQAYDLVFCDANRSEDLDYLEASLRVLRPGGVVAFAGGLAGGRIADPSARDAETTAMRELAKAMREDERFVSAAIPVGPGLLAAAKRT